MDDVMDEIVNFHIPDSPNATSVPHPKFASYYKPKISTFDQEERRAALLRAQKARREEVLDGRRGISLLNGDEEDEEMASSESEAVEEVGSPDMALVERSRKFRTWLSADDLKDKLMYSEWLVDVPGNLRSDWLFVMCPQGCRCLVVAADGKTVVFSTGGNAVKSFSSLLPGGNPASKESMTVLDCISDGQMFHILDALCWNRHSLLDYETDVRINQLRTLAADLPTLGVPSAANPFRFAPLPYYPVTELEDRIKGPLPFEGKLDGVLFYHKKTVYTHGYTPLVGWLKTPMLPKLLNVKLPSNLLKGTELSLWRQNQNESSNLLAPPLTDSYHRPKQAEVMEIVELPDDADVGDLPVVVNHPLM